MNSFLCSGHPERSEAESKDPEAQPNSLSTGFLDFARNDSVFNVSTVQLSLRSTILLIFLNTASESALIFWTRFWRRLLNFLSFS